MTHPDLNNQAERAEDPRITAFYKLRDIAERDWDVESANIIAAAISELHWRREDAARAAPPALDAEGLPPLGEPFANFDPRCEGAECPVYTAEQVRRAQRDAVEIARKREIALADEAISIKDKIIADLRAQLARQSAPEGAPVGMGGWLPIESAPQDWRTILLGLFNSRGNWRTMRGQWYSEAAIADEWEDPDAGEEGWYETAAEPDPPNCWSVHPTHWMPLPSAPQPARQDQQPAQHDHSEGGHDAVAQQAGPNKRIADALNTTLWLYRRLPTCYGKPPFVDAAIMAFADVLGLDAPAAIQERYRLHVANHSEKGQPDAG